MTPTEIRVAIQADPALQALVPDTQAIADALSAGCTRVATRIGGIGTVLEALGPVDGATLLDTLDLLRATSSPVKWAWYLIERGELDFGSVATRGMIQQLQIGGVLTAPQASSLLALAEVPDPVDEYTVRRAIYADDGSLLV